MGDVLRKVWQRMSVCHRLTALTGLLALCLLVWVLAAGYQWQALPLVLLIVLAGFGALWADEAGV